MITISSIDDSGKGARFDELCALLPRISPLFDLELVKANFNALEVKKNGDVVGICLYKVFKANGVDVLYCGGLALDASAGAISGDVYKWLIDESRRLDCAYFVFDSVRKGVVKFAVDNGLTVGNVQYFCAIERDS